MLICSRKISSDVYVSGDLAMHVRIRHKVAISTCVFIVFFVIVEYF